LVKDAQDPDNAKVYFTLHDHSKFETLSRSPLLSLNDISKVHLTGTERSKPILYILDGKLLTDTVAVRIPSICVRNVTIVKAAETSYLKTVLPDALLLMISTQIPGIMIKGAAAAN
jgi:hypothetical protein